MEYILNVRSFFALLYKEVSVKYILRLPPHGYKSSHSFRMTFNRQRSYPLFSSLWLTAHS